MEMTLNALVRSALSEADEQLKLASTQDVVLDPLSKLAMPMDLGDEGDEGSDDDDETKTKGKKKKKEECGEGDEEKTSGLNLADHAMKLAEAIDHVGMMWAKQSEAMPTFAGQHNVGDSTQHTKTSPATVPAAQAGSGGGPSENSQGYPAGIDTNAREFKSPEWVGNPEAREGAIRVKGAKPGETAAGKTASMAARHHNLLRQHGAKFAADPSSPQPVGISKGRDPGKLDMVPPSPTEIPGNNGMATLTKKKAKTKHVQNDASKILSEPAFSGRTDKGISDNLAQTGGNKIANIGLAGVEAVAKGSYKNPALRRALGGGAAGAVVGGLAGANYADPGDRLKGALGGAALGGGMGALTGGIHGSMEANALRGMAKGDIGMKGVSDIGRLQTGIAVLGGAGAIAGGADAANIMRTRKRRAAEMEAAEGKTASQTAAARTYLSKIASQAQNPHASPRMRVKVAKFHQALQHINMQRQG